MPNFVEIICQIKIFSIQELVFDRYVGKSAISYSGPMFTVPINTQLLKDKWMCEKTQIDISKTDGLIAC